MHAIEDLLVATPLPHAREVMESRVRKRRQQREWDSRMQRLEVWVFFLLDDAAAPSHKDHARIARILSIPEQEVRDAIIELCKQHLVTMEVKIMQQEESQLDPQLLGASFAAISPHKERFAEAFYTRLFEQYPAARQMFPVDMKAQKAALMGELAFIVAGVVKNDDISANLQSLGHRHMGYGVTDEQYRLAGQVLLDTLKWFFETHPTELCWNKRLEQTWKQAYMIVMDAMLKG